MIVVIILRVGVGVEASVYFRFWKFQPQRLDLAEERGLVNPEFLCGGEAVAVVVLESGADSLGIKSCTGTA